MSWKSWQRIPERWKDIPAWCKKMGHDFLGSFEEAGSIHLFLRKAK